jgi:hypothetical protein
VDTGYPDTAEPLPALSSGSAPKDDNDYDVAREGLSGALVQNGILHSSEVEVCLGLLPPSPSQ